jgi:hypothetical protein
MELTAVGAIFMALWMVAALRGYPAAIGYSIVLLPFGASATLNLPSVGGLSLLSLQVAAMLSIALALAHGLAGRSGDGALRIPAAGITLALLCAYGLLSAVFVPRLLANDFLVISLSRSEVGGPVDPLLTPPRVPLQPSSSNLSQAAYLMVSCGLFLATCAAAQRRGIAYIERAVRLAAAVNVVLGLLDLLSLDVLLEPLRTANYDILFDHEIAGLPRVIGGFSEASAFGAMSAGFAAFFAMRSLTRPDRWSIPLALANAALAIMSLSSTAYAGLAITAALIGIDCLRRLTFERIPYGLTLGLMLLVGALAAVVVMIAVTPALNGMVMQVLEQLVFDKQSSMSALQREAWAEYGYRAFLDSHGLGAGLGSVRASGLASVVLANVGVPGALLLLLFLWQTVLRPAPSSGVATATLSIFQSARTAAVALLTMKMASATIVDPGIAFLTFAAIACVGRVKVAATESDYGLSRREVSLP